MMMHWRINCYKWQAYSFMVCGRGDGILPRSFEIHTTYPAYQECLSINGRDEIDVLQMQ